MKQTISRFRGAEVTDFHPIVQKHLENQGYTVEHHVRLPFGGTVDFRAINEIECVLVEAKINRDDLIQAIGQVKGYEWQIPHSVSAVAAPSCCVTGRIKTAFASAGVRLLCVDCPPDFTYTSQNRLSSAGQENTRDFIQHFIQMHKDLDMALSVIEQQDDQIERLLELCESMQGELDKYHKEKMDNLLSKIACEVLA